MKISLDWIGDFVDVSDIDVAELSDRLTMGVAEVEGYQHIQRNVAGIFVGEIVAVEPLEEGGPVAGRNRLAKVEVACGTRSYVTVSRAPNLSMALKTAFAPVGSRLAGGIEVSPEVRAGIPSDGVLCSAAELGMSNWHEAILELPPGTPSGSRLDELIPATDTLVDIDNKSLTHRPDLWGHFGFAREIAAILKRPLRSLKLQDLSSFDALPEIGIRVDNPELCKAYSAIRADIGCSALTPASLVVQRRLHALGQRTHGLMVDLSNYVMLELGQPTHAFDGDLVDSVRVATAGKPAKFTTLDGREHSLQPEDLLIFGNSREGSRPVALAGIMGGSGTEVCAATTKILLESANFAAARVRRTAVRLGLRTESSQRYEKNLPRVHVKIATARILHLLSESGISPKMESKFSLVGDPGTEPRSISLAPGYIQRMAGAPISEERVIEILGSLEFQTRSSDDSSLLVDIPPHRTAQDISRPADLLEEVLRVHGYGNIVPQAPITAVRPVPIEEKVYTHHRVRRLLSASHQFLEVHTYAWFSQAWNRTLGFEPTNALELLNPATADQGRMCTTLIPNLLALIAKNRIHRDRFRLFELGRTYNDLGSGEVDEHTVLTAVSYISKGTGRAEDDFCEMKGVLQDIGVVAGFAPITFAPIAASSCPWEETGRTAKVLSGTEDIGRIGLLSDVLRDLVVEIGEVVWFELKIDRSARTLFPVVEYANLPTFPGSWQDFSMLWRSGDYKGLADLLDVFRHPILKSRDFLYVFAGKGVPTGIESYSFRFWLGLPDRTLLPEDINSFRESLLAYLASQGISLR